LLPVSVGYLGVQEGAFVVLLGLAGIETSAAFGLSILFRLVDLLVYLPGVVLFFTHGLHSLKPSRAQAVPVREQV
jgi:hypothetical protein